MGHVCSIQTFSDKLQRNTIQNRCYAWQRDNCDHMECGPKGPRFSVGFTNLLFETYDEAEKYLFGTFGDYRQTAVKYKDGKKTMWAVACEVHH